MPQVRRLRRRLSRIAERHLADIAGFISRDNPLAAETVIRRILKATERLERLPYSGRPGDIEGARELVVPGLPYIVVYTIGRDTVDLHGVFHGARDPGGMSEGTMSVVRTVIELRAAVARWRRAGDSVGLVPTMGALHRGHLSLVAAARASCRRAIVTIFVNPKQFGPREDFARYPRQEDADFAALRNAQCDLVFAPGVAEIYPDGFATSVAVAALTERWEGAMRPGHFAGVATVVAKLLLQSLPDRAFFGEKDYQQLQVVKRLARDLDIPVEIVGCPTVREPDGLALSSRNALLSADERRCAPALVQALKSVVRAARNGDALVPAIAAGKAALMAAGFAAIDYLALIDAATLEPIDRLIGPARAIGAARLGGVRLIDNLAV